MGPAVVISAVRRSRSHQKRKRRYESVPLQEYRGSRSSRSAPQMVSVDVVLAVSTLDSSRAYRRRPPSARRADFERSARRDAVRRGGSSRGGSSKGTFVVPKHPLDGRTLVDIRPREDAARNRRFRAHGPTCERSRRESLRGCAL